MDFVECIRVSEEGAKTGLCTKEDGPPAIFCARIILRIRIAKDPPAQRDELFLFSWSYKDFRHSKNKAGYAPASPKSLLSRLDFGNEDLKRTDGQSARRLGGERSLGAGENDAQFFAFDLFEA